MSRAGGEFRSTRAGAADEHDDAPDQRQAAPDNECIPGGFSGPPRAEPPKSLLALIATKRPEIERQREILVNPKRSQTVILRFTLGTFSLHSRGLNKHRSNPIGRWRCRTDQRDSYGKTISLQETKSARSFYLGSPWANRMASPLAVGLKTKARTFLFFEFMREQTGKQGAPWSCSLISRERNRYSRLAAWPWRP